MITCIGVKAALVGSIGEAPSNIKSGFFDVKVMVLDVGEHWWGTI